jgi:transposase-like protein
LRKCKNCGSKFSPADGFIRRRFQKEHIVEAVYLYQDGLSLSKVKDHMWQHHGVKVSRWMILLWCRDYSRIISNFTETLKPEIKGNVHAMIIKAKVKKKWCWGTKDRKTKFKLLDSSLNEEVSGAKHVFEKIRNGCIGIPEKIITDKLGYYRRAYNMFFYRLRGSCKLVHGVPIGL